ncbi:UDP-N-acetylmuramate--alanine ligase [Sphingomonas sp. Leaf407]|uniref:glutamate ligase domain-containing protein n=1 Tax=unclassified Sphingomonas TaxID=196159 RepID=UPI0006F221BC|nr:MULTISPECIES: Mur ligase family protein [unclassified Sphingomonas]KQN39587.1 UDP-N-acetylmuramate--alanine ligase [Sphingomonas sp. Leaf42]KQT28864.1 UDP-N-acetylmuramate--alanine ligase [Sphingomonas sp. Leaf407]
MLHGKSFFLVGIGGSGMLPLAMILAGRGATVAGSDRSLDTDSLPAKFDSLRAADIALFPQDGSGIVSADQIVVASAAIEPTVADIVAAVAVGARRMGRAELLAELFNAAALPIGVAGTSGKSTVTGMIGHILHMVGRDPTVMNGAVMKNFIAPDRPFASALVGTGDAFVSEVDESDGSIAFYRPRIAVLNNVSLDHKSLEELRTLFGGFAARAGHTIVNVGDAEAAALAMEMAENRRTTFAIDAPADMIGCKLCKLSASVDFTLRVGDRSYDVHLAVPGAHNVANALAAIGAVVAAGVPIEGAIAAIAGFTGLKRRFELVGTAGGVTVIDDFGHNPDKIAATIATLRAHPGRLLLLFQPHGYGPLKVMRRELVAMFAARLQGDDLLVLPDPVYRGGTVSRDVTSADIVADLAVTGTPARHIPDRAAAAAHLAAQARPGDRIVVMGARDDTLSALAASIVTMLEART